MWRELMRFWQAPQHRTGPGVKDYHKGLHRRTYPGGNYPGSTRRRAERERRSRSAKG